MWEIESNCTVSIPTGSDGAKLCLDRVKHLKSSSDPVYTPGAGSRVIKSFTPPYWWRRLFWLLALCSLFAALFLFRVPLLTGAAQAWIVDEPLQKADAIVVLGGGMETRPFEAAKLYHAGLAPKILLLNTRLSPTEELGITKTHTQIANEILLKNGVPKTSIVTIGEGVASTHDESIAVREWVLNNRPKRLIIPTDLFHTRRVHWLFGRVVKTNEVTISIKAINPREYAASNWWRHEEGLISFQNEVLKYAYYRQKY